MKKGAWLVNTARGAICIRQDVADAVASGHLNGYAGDVWGTSRSLTSRQVMTNGQMFSPLPRITLGERWSTLLVRLAGSVVNCVNTNIQAVVTV